MTQKTKVAKSSKKRGARKKSTAVTDGDNVKPGKKQASTASKATPRTTIEPGFEQKPEFTTVPYQGIAIIPLVKPAGAAAAEPKYRGKQGKLALAIDIALDAVAATDYVLRKYTKAGGIEERLHRLGQKAEPQKSKRSRK